MDKKLFTFLNCLCVWSYALGPKVVAEAVTDSPQITTDFSQAITVKNCGTSIFPPSVSFLIVGGQNALHGHYPWMISLQEDDGNGFEHDCGASVINENWIITAAHCIDYMNEPNKYQALAGLHNLSREDASTVQRIKISKIVLHEDYDKIPVKNDIALLKTAKPIDISGSKGYVNGICLPETDVDPTGNATVIGWGYTYEKDYLGSDVLREVVVPIVARDLCKESYGNVRGDKSDEIDDTKVCAGDENEDSCKNDSGGPLFQTSSNGVSTLIGIVSYGTGCGDKNFPGVYTKVSSYLNWMEKVMAKY